MRLRLVLVAVAIVACGMSASTQGSDVRRLAWQPARTSPAGRVVESLVEAYEAGPLIAAARWYGNGNSGSVLHRSTDDGRTWVECRRLAPQEPLANLPDRFRDGGVVGSLLTGGSLEGALATDTMCEQFRAPQLPSAATSTGDRPVAMLGQDLVVMPSAVFASSDFGRTWKQTLTWGYSPEPPCTEYSVNDLLLVVQQKLFRSRDNGMTWVEDATVNVRDARLRCPLIKADGGSFVYARGTEGLWRSSIWSGTWSRVFEANVDTFTVRGSRLYVATSTFPSRYAFLRSLDDGKSWTVVAVPGDGGVKAILETRRGTLLAATDHGIYRSADRGDSWTIAGLPATVFSLAANGARMFAEAESDAWSSDDVGESWTRIPETARDAATDRPAGARRFLDLEDGRLVAKDRSRNDAGGLVVSSDGGTTWARSGLDHEIVSVARVGKTWFAGTTAGVFRSDDLVRWVECSAGLNQGVAGLVVTPDEHLIAVGVGNGTYRSTNGCRSWWRIADSPFYGVSDRGSMHVNFRLVRSRSLGMLAFGYGVSQLSLATREWTRREDVQRVTSVAEDANGRLWVGTTHGVKLLTVNGEEWTFESAGFDAERITALAYHPAGYLVAAVEGFGLFRARLLL